MSEAQGGTPATRPADAHPITGEILDLALRDLDELAALRDELGELKRVIDSTLAGVDLEVTARLDHENTRSARIGEWELTTEAPDEDVWDAGELGIVLEALVQAGRLSRRAAEAALEPVTTFKPRARELAKLLRAPSEDVREAIALCRVTRPRARRRVTVRRAPHAQRRVEAP